MKKIILDTNFLLIPALFKVDIFEEIKRICDFQYELCVLDKTLDELEKVIQTTKKGKDKEAAKLAMGLIKSKHINIIETESIKNVDDLILDLLNQGDYIVATQDKALKDKIRAKNAQIIVLRQKNHLKLE